MRISEIKKNAREALTGKWGKGVSIILANLAVSLVISFIHGLFQENSLISSLLKIAMLIIEVPIALGLAYAFIKLKRGEEIKAFDFLNLGFSNFGRAWKITLRTFLKLILPEIVMILGAGMIGLSVGIVAGNEALYAEPEVATLILMCIGWIVLIAAWIWSIARRLSYSLTLFVAYDNPEMRSLEVVNESARMMNGNRWKIFLLELSFLGWAILGIFTLGIGYLWLIPYINVAEICFYDYLLGKNENNNTDNNDVVTEL